MNFNPFFSNRFYNQELCLANLEFFEIPFLYNDVTFHAENSLRSSIICIFSGGMLISSALFVFPFSFGSPIEVILSAILFPIRSPVTSAVF